MSYSGNWIFHSIASVNENDEMVFLTAEEFLNSPMPYVDASDEEAVAEELQDRRKLIGSQIKVCDDGKLYLLMPLPEGVSQEEVDAAVASGEIALVDGMMTDRPMDWEERNGELWYNSGMEGEVFGETADPWVKAIDENGYFTFATTRFIKVN